MVTAPAVVHFFSYATGVSLELPVGFELVAEDEQSATYADRPEDGPATATTPTVRIRVVGTLEDDDGRAAVRGLADGFAATGLATISRQDREIDECPAATVVSRDGGRILQQTAVAADARVLSIIAVAATEEQLPAYDAALDSIRFIAI